MKLLDYQSDEGNRGCTDRQWRTWRTKQPKNPCRLQVKINADQVFEKMTNWKKSKSIEPINHEASEIQRTYELIVIYIKVSKEIGQNQWESLRVTEEINEPRQWWWINKHRLMKQRKLPSIELQCRIKINQEGKTQSRAKMAELVVLWYHITRTKLRESEKRENERKEFYFHSKQNNVQYIQS